MTAADLVNASAWFPGWIVPVSIVVVVLAILVRRARRRRLGPGGSLGPPAARAARPLRARRNPW